MSKVIGTVPNIDFPHRKDYIVEYNGDWWIGYSTTVYRSVGGIRSENESDLANIVKAAEFQIAAGKLKLNHYSYAELLDMYKPVKDALEIKRKKEEREGIFWLFMLVLVTVLPWLLRK